MESIKRRWIIYALLSLVSIFLTGKFAIIQKCDRTIFFGAVASIVLIFLYRQSRMLYSANLIYNNRILTVPSSIITTDNLAIQKLMDETVVSTFGLLLRNKVYKWGCDGIYGVRLHKVSMDKEHIWLTFGDDDQQLQVELMHGMTDGQDIIEISRKLWYEIGIKADVNVW